MKVGYGRVSRHEQNKGLQVDALTAAGCERIFFDEISGAAEKVSERQDLQAALDFIRPGDTFVVWKLDRAGRSLKHLIELMNDLQTRGIEFESLTEKIDTSTPMGKLIFHFTAAVAEFERDLIRERTKAGLEAARARGRRGGPTVKFDQKKIKRAQERYDRGDRVVDICEDMHMGRTTFYRYVQVEKKQQQITQGA